MLTIGEHDDSGSGYDYRRFTVDGADVSASLIILGVFAVLGLLM